MHRLKIFRMQQQKDLLRRSFGSLFTYFIQGMVVLAPIAITCWAVYSLFYAVDNFLPNIVNYFFPRLLPKDAEGHIKTIPGLGFVVIILFILLVGRLSSFFFISRIVALFDKVLEKTPGVKFLYSSVKDFFEAFAGNKKKFDKPVLVNIEESGVWRIGFITQSDMTDFGLPDFYTVYVPQSYAIQGSTFIVPKSKIKPLTNMTAAEAMKFTLTGGVTQVEDKH